MEKSGGHTFNQIIKDLGLPLMGQLDVTGPVVMPPEHGRAPLSDEGHPWGLS